MVFESGRVSTMRTTSPTFAEFCSSWAWNFDGAPDDLLVPRVRLDHVDLHDDRLVHRARDDDAAALLACGRARAPASAGGRSACARPAGTLTRRALLGALGARERACASSSAATAQAAAGRLLGRRRLCRRRLCLGGGLPRPELQASAPASASVLAWLGRDSGRLGSSGRWPPRSQPAQPESPRPSQSFRVSSLMRALSQLSRSLTHRQNPRDLALRQLQPRAVLERAGHRLEAQVEELLTPLVEPSSSSSSVRSRSSLGLVKEISLPLHDLRLDRTASGRRAAAPPWRAAPGRRPART